ncbi:MAG: hypothetical protein R3224_03275, partial [Balneolaceae bacterium]|nr:hypothetical protein [Balneolaceae bacterium]
MSLINQNQSFSVQDYLFVAVGLLGIFGFFMTYAPQEPRSIIKTSLDRQSAILKAAEIANTLGFSTGEFETSATFRVDRRLLDSLQYRMGRENTIDTLIQARHPNIKPYYWEVEFSKAAGTGPDEEELPPEENQSGDTPAAENRFLVLLSDSGRWFSLTNRSYAPLPERLVNREALKAVFGAGHPFLASEDSAILGGLTFNVSDGYDQSLSDSLERPPPLPAIDLPHQYSLEEVTRLAEYHFNRADWDLSAFELSSIRTERVRSNPAAHLRFVTQEPVLQRRHWQGVAGYGALITVAVMGVFFLAQNRYGMPPEQATTLSFLT